MPLLIVQVSHKITVNVFTVGGRVSPDNSSGGLTRDVVPLGLVASQMYSKIRSSDSSLSLMVKNNVSTCCNIASSQNFESDVGQTETFPQA